MASAKTRDYGKYAYPNPQIPLDSELWQYLLEESKQTGTSVNKLIPVLLLRYYKGQGYQLSSSLSSSSFQQGEEESTQSRAAANALAFLTQEE